MFDPLGTFQKSQMKEGFALWMFVVHFALRRCMDTSTAILVNADALPEILTAKELEALIRIDVKTIYRYVQLGLIPHLRMESNVRFPKYRVLRWLEERSFSPRPVNGNGAKKRQ